MRQAPRTVSRLPGLALNAALMLAPLAAWAFLAENRAEVLPVSDGVFEVTNSGGSAAQHYWCGAGDYAISQLRTGATQRVYIWQALGPSVNRPGRKSVQFALQPPPGANTTPGYSLSVRAVGDNMTAAAAREYCWDFRLLDP